MAEGRGRVIAGARRMLGHNRDEALVAGVRRRDRRAFEAIYERHAAQLLTFCIYLLGSRHDAEDALQATFASAYRALLNDSRPVEPAPVAVHDRPQRVAEHPAQAPPAGRAQRRGGADGRPGEARRGPRGDGQHDRRHPRAAREATRGIGAGRGPRDEPRRDRVGARRPPRPGEGVRVPGPFQPPLRPPRPRSGLPRDPRRARHRTRARADPGAAAPSPALLRRMPRLCQRRRAPAPPARLAASDPAGRHPPLPRDRPGARAVRQRRRQLRQQRHDGRHRPGSGRRRDDRAGGQGRDRDRGGRCQCRRRHDGHRHSHVLPHAPAGGGPQRRLECTACLDLDQGARLPYGLRRPGRSRRQGREPGLRLRSPPPRTVGGRQGTGRT